MTRPEEQSHWASILEDLGLETAPSAPQPDKPARKAPAEVHAKPAEAPPTPEPEPPAAEEAPARGRRRRGAQAERRGDSCKAMLNAF